MFKLSKLADYAVVIIAALGEHEEPVSASTLSEQTRLPEPTVAKVLKILASGDIVMSKRGIKGGYILSHPLDALNIKDVITTVDGPIALTACVDDTDGTACELSSMCAMHGRWDQVNRAMKEALANVTLAQMLNRNLMKKSA